MCAHANFLKQLGFLCGCSALCWSIWGIDHKREVEGGRGFYGQWVFRKASKITLGNIVWLSLKWLLEAYSAQMSKRWTMLRCAPFFW